MNHPTFKLTALGVLTFAVQQFAFADSPMRQTLPQFQAQDIPALCDAKIQDIDKQLKIFAAKPMSAQQNAAPVLAEWDRIFASFEDFYESSSKPCSYSWLVYGVVAALTQVRILDTAQFL